MDAVETIQPKAATQSGGDTPLPQAGEERIEWARQHSKMLRGKSTDEILAWAVDTFGEQLGFMTALGYSGIVLLDHLRRFVPQVRAHFIDTRFHFHETIELLKRLENEMGVVFTVLTPAMSDNELTAHIGSEAWRNNPDLCCLHRKVDPLLRVLRTRASWLSALRRDQTATRSEIETLEIDGRGVLKIYPLADWSAERCWAYVRERKLPYNPLHDEGYLSVGCTHCTHPARTGEQERAGRWNSMPKMECGIHLHRTDRM